MKREILFDYNVPMDNCRLQQTDVYLGIAAINTSVGPLCRIINSTPFTNSLILSWDSVEKDVKSIAADLFIDDLLKNIEKKAP